MGERKRSLLLGCGRRYDRLVSPHGTEHEGWGDLTTLDVNPDHEPDILWDLQYGDPRGGINVAIFNIPLPDNHFNEIHAYEVLEHIGQQGDHRTFFAQFSDYWRLLKPGGYFCATVPRFDSVWAWGDPSHKRVINQGTLSFLSQMEYRNQVGKTAMSDFRHVYKADFDLLGCSPFGESLAFILSAVKPSRWEGK